MDISWSELLDDLSIAEISDALCFCRLPGRAARYRPSSGVPSIV